MRRLNIIVGIKKRINDIFGNHPDGNPDNITNWSVQSDMLENMKRIGKGLTSDNVAGCVLRGLDVNHNNKDINITSGVGVTKGGYFINLENTFKINYFDKNDYNNGNYNYIVIHYHIEKDTNGEYVSIHNNDNKYIEYDEYSHTADTLDELGDESNLSSGDSFVTLESSIPSDDNSLVIAQIDYNSSTGNVVVYKNSISLPDNSSVNGDFNATGNISSNGGFSSNGQFGVSGTFTTNDGKTVTITNGIITEVTS